MAQRGHKVTITFFVDSIDTIGLDMDYLRDNWQRMAGKCKITELARDIHVEVSRATFFENGKDLLHR